MDDQFTASVKGKMLQAVDITKKDLATVRTGRATPALIDQIEILTYGGTQKLKLRELCTFTTPDAQTILVHPFDVKTSEDIIKGIQAANIGYLPIAQGNDIRISVPLISEDRRLEYIKLVQAKLEAGKIMVRQVRHEEMARLKRTYEAKEVTEDEKKREEKLIQVVTDEMIAELDHLGELKKKELLQI